MHFDDKINDKFDVDDLYGDDINDYNERDYPELNPGLKKHLLSRPFTQRGANSLNIKVIAAYMEDEDIAQKALQIEDGKRFKSILKHFRSACDNRLKDVTIATNPYRSDKTYFGMAARWSAYACTFILLRGAVYEKVQPPANKDAVLEWHRLQDRMKKLSGKMEIPFQKQERQPETLSMFLKRNKDYTRDCIEANGANEKHSSPLKDERFRKMFQDIQSDVDSYFNEIHSSKYPTDEEKIAHIEKLMEEKYHELQKDAPDIEQKEEHLGRWEQCIKYIDELQDKYDSLHQG